MKKKDLSVIICVYNTNIDLFRECLLSIKNSISKNLDVVIIDDGSNLDYCNLKKEFKDFNWIKTENHGTLKAREIGANNAKSDIVCYVDSDDVVSFDYFQAFIEEYNRTKNDIIINDWAFWTQKTKYICGNDSTIKSNFYCNNENVLAKFFEYSGFEHSYFVLWNKAFKKEIILKSFEKISSYLLENFVFSEDVLITYFAYSLAKSLSNIHCGFYFYRIHDLQQINASSKLKLKNQIECNARTFDIIEADLKRNNNFNKYYVNFKKWKDLIASNFFSIAKRTNNIDLYDLIKNLYNQQRLKKISKKADYFYGNHKLLPTNFLDIDNNLKTICKKNNKNTFVFCVKKKYTYKRILELNRYLNSNIIVVFKKDYNAITIKKEKYDLKQKIVHNDLVYKIGTKLFPKGSKIRKFLKSRL